ncbi:hypothetical protein LCGC14_0731950 [marine sediment metagenome]|uniref:Uncharacterized protein n=1 Tax=marine sediment metagenome TaxID=412755 RepID=A0A0F9QDD8_9ZZZZ
MTKLNLSQKLFIQDGKKYAYANDIQKAVRELKEFLLRTNMEANWKEVFKDFNKIFGGELNK